jgi:CheY-like chemotaxis protein
LLKAWPPVTISVPAILVVQDEPSSLHIASVFCAAGYEVTAVVGAAKAMSVLESRGPFALYVIDLPIPSERGTVLAAAIRRSQADARILYVTAFTEALFTLLCQGVGTCRRVIHGHSWRSSSRPRFHT